MKIDLFTVVKMMIHIDLLVNYWKLLDILLLSLDLSRADSSANPRPSLAALLCHVAGFQQPDDCSGGCARRWARP